jgi:CheY-like chemotaxis protein
LSALDVRAHALRGTGFAIVQMTDAPAALRRAAQRLSPGLVVLDLDFPGADAFELCQQLKADPYTRRIAVLLVRRPSSRRRTVCARCRPGGLVLHGAGHAARARCGDGHARFGGPSTATLAHETTHWTAHESRLARDFGSKGLISSEGYAIEELVAELGAAFLCADLDLTLEPREDHVAYIGNWLGVLKADNRAIFTAASHAQRAATSSTDCSRLPLAICDRDITGAATPFARQERGGHQPGRQPRTPDQRVRMRFRQLV